LDERARLVHEDVSLADIADEALRMHVQRIRLLEFFDEMDREFPISPEEQAAGEKIWKRIASSSIQARSQSSPERKDASASRSAKRSRKAPAMSATTRA